MFAMQVSGPIPNFPIHRICTHGPWTGTKPVKPAWPDDSSNNQVGTAATNAAATNARAMAIIANGTLLAQSRNRWQHAASGASWRGD
jgi:hypothetical protein